MNEIKYPALPTYRGTIFDPAVTDEHFALSARSNDFSAILGLAHGPVSSTGIKLIRKASLADTYKLLDDVAARFDLIVSAPPAGAIPAKGLPRGVSAVVAAKPAARKLVLSGAAVEQTATVDRGYAVFLIANELLTSFGEALLKVTPESYELIKRDRHYSRVWAEHVGEGGRVWLYLARDHRPLPGSTNRVTDPTANDRHRIRGATVTYLTRTEDSERKFYTVREELGRTGKLEHNLRLENGKIRVQFTEFQLMSGAVPQRLIEDADRLRNQTLVDLAVMRETRDLARRVLTDSDLHVAPGLVAAFDDVCRQMAVLTAPFSRPSAVQRVAWLDEQNKIECVRDFGSFRAGQTYTLETRTVTGRKIELRHRAGHTEPEEVHVSGQEVLVEIYADPATGGDGLNHAFTQFPITEQMDNEWKTYAIVGAGHTLNELLVHFKMPEVADIAEADPETYLSYVAKLRALETV